jgi:hypothetical protein
MPDQLPTPIIPTRLLTAEEFQGLAEVPPEVEWFRNLKNANTERAYRNAIQDFMRFTGIARPEEFRIVTRAHVIEWRKDLKRREIGRVADKRNPTGATIRHRLAALVALRISLREERGQPQSGQRRQAAERPRAAKARRRRSAIIRPASCSPHPAINASRTSVIAPPCRRCLFHALRREELAS